MPLDPLWLDRFAAFDSNDVGVRAALRHLADDWPHAQFLSLRRAPSVANVDLARGLLGAEAPPWLVEGFVARPLERLGDEEGALRARLELLPRVPRWEGLLAAHVLARLARGATRLGMLDHAVTAARRALRFFPAEPLAQSTLAEALAARGEVAEARSIRAFLWDCGYGPDVLAGEPTSDERVATPLVPSLTELEPMSLEDRARFAVFSINDPSLIDSVTSVLRHVAVLLRCGHVALAWANLAALVAWEPQGSDVCGWLGVEGDSDRRDRMRAVVLDLLVATPAGEQAAAAEKKKAPLVARKSLTDRLEGVAACPPEAVEPALLDFYVGVRQAARLRLPSHPLVERAHALEQQDPTLVGLYGHEPWELYGQAQALSPLWCPGARPNQPPSSTELNRALYVGRAADVLDHIPAHAQAPASFVEPARAAKPVCKGCKAPFEPGEPQLRFRDEWAPLAKAVPYHLRCATKGKPRAALEVAGPRYRRQVFAGGS